MDRILSRQKKKRCGRTDKKTCKHSQKKNRQADRQEPEREIRGSENLFIRLLFFRRRRRHRQLCRRRRRTELSIMEIEKYPWIFDLMRVISSLAEDEKVLAKIH